MAHVSPSIRDNAVTTVTRLASEGYLAATTLNRFNAAAVTEAKLFVDYLKIMEPK